MKWEVTMHSPKYTDYDGHIHEEKATTFECPFDYCQTVYYAFKKNPLKRKSKWAVRKSRVTGIWATNMCGVTLDNNEHIEEDRFDRLFTDKETAIDFCLKKNQQSKVKIYD